MRQRRQERYLVAAALADALLAAPHSADSMYEQAVMALGRRHRWLRPLIGRVRKQYGETLVQATRRKLIRFMLADAGFDTAFNRESWPYIAHYPLAGHAGVAPPAALATLPLPSLPDLASMARWLDIAPTELEWFADRRGMNRASLGGLCHFHYRWVAKRSGGNRLIEAPKPRLRDLQRKLLREILDLVPPHEAAHGFRRGHSCKTFVDGHIGQRVVLRFDLDNFFGSIPAPRVEAMFRSLGYPERVAKSLTGLCTVSTPGSVLAASSLAWHERDRFRTRHLPQGAPTSPALANLCAFGLDCRLKALAKSFGGHYSRYADDLAISGGEAVRRAANFLVAQTGAIVAEAGFSLNFKKTKIMHQSDRQILTGTVINTKANVRRDEYDRLKAILHNCLHDGTAAQNINTHTDFRAHLFGRIQHIATLNTARGTKLMQLFHQLSWQTGSDASLKGVLINSVGMDGFH